MEDSSIVHQRRPSSSDCRLPNAVPFAECRLPTAEVVGPDLPISLSPDLPRQSVRPTPDCRLPSRLPDRPTARSPDSRSNRPSSSDCRLPNAVPFAECRLPTPAIYHNINNCKYYIGPPQWTIPSPKGGGSSEVQSGAQTQRQRVTGISLWCRSQPLWRRYRALRFVSERTARDLGPSPPHQRRTRPTPKEVGSNWNPPTSTFERRGPTPEQRAR